MLMPSIFGENLFDSFFDDFAKPVRHAKLAMPASSVMKTDILESEEGFEIDIDLPGYKKEDVNAKLKDGYLTVSAASEKIDEEKDEKGKYIRRERYSGSCSRSFYVGKDVTQEDIKAKFADGILKIEVPKKQPVPEVEENKYILIEG